MRRSSGGCACIQKGSHDGLHDARHYLMVQLAAITGAKCGILNATITLVFASVGYRQRHHAVARSTVLNSEIV